MIYLMLKEEIIFKNKIGRIRDIQVHPATGKIYFKPGCNVVNAKKIVYNKVYG